MSAMQRNKGKAGELEVVGLVRDLTGVRARLRRRLPASVTRHRACRQVSDKLGRRCARKLLIQNGNSSRRLLRRRAGTREI